MPRRALTPGLLLFCWSLLGLLPCAPLARGETLRDPTSEGWHSIGRSGRGQSIYAQTVGDGPRRVLVIAGLSGVEPSGPALADYFAAFLRRHPEIVVQSSVTIVHAINPDGLIARTAFNRRGVELDRNFATRDWVRGQQTQAVLTGPTAGSEPESQLVTQLIAQTQPELLIVLGGSPRTPQLSATSTARESIRLVEEFTNWPVADWPAAERPGALLTLAEERGLPAVLVQLPFDQRSAGLWSAGVRALATLCDSQAAAEYERVVASSAPVTVAARPEGPASRQAGVQPARGAVLRYAELSLRAPLAKVELPQSLRADRLTALQSSASPPDAPLVQGQAPAAASQSAQPAAQRSPAVQRLPAVAADEFPTAIWQSPQTPIPAYPQTKTP